MKLFAVAGVIVSLGASAVGAQQQVVVTVVAVPNPVPAGSCARILADVRNELNQQLTLENGVPLQWSSYDYATSNGTDFEWRSAASGEFELCAKASAGAVNTQVTATIKGMTHSGTTLVAVGAQPGAAAPNAGGAAPGGIASASPPPAGTQPAAAPATVPAQPYVPAPAYAPPAQDYAPPAQPYAPPQNAAPTSPPAGAAQPPAAAPPPPQQAQAQPVKSGGGFFKKIGSHIKQKAAEVKAETAQNLTTAATQVVDTTFQTGSRLVASTTAEVSNTARMGIGGVGRQLMLAPQRGGANADNLALAIASGRAVLLEMRFTPGTDVLEPSARELVRRLAVELRTAMATTPTARFVIEGHVDSVPNAQVLSEYRAAAVKAALSSNGVDTQRLIALGYGTSRPLQPGGPPVARIEIAQTQ
jgi:outer membrane protein OmpA-like peptidoglycan-associated protein